jgi:hypothetical protein
MLYTLMNIVGPLLLLGVIVWAYFYSRGRSRRADQVRDEGTRELRDELNDRDTADQRRL